MILGTMQFQLPPDIISIDLTSNHGKLGLERLHVFPTVQASFRIISVALSGLQIDKLDLKNLPTKSSLFLMLQIDSTSRVDVNVNFSLDICWFCKWPEGLRISVTSCHFDSLFTFNQIRT
ncbi:ap-3 complex subunit mu [Quercus suber]|uniref:Ap-3 complex subunit mu n=1 Tax=Quercus suber TaxID=58331 RepID=A0AAW0MB28_QUESU